MDRVSNERELPTHLFMILLLASITTALGCGVIPAGQASTPSAALQLCLFRWYTLLKPKSRPVFLVLQLARR
ncbi:hypothetical protein KIN20_016754 [Parelaphostrongylus tenuis]|uniref:Uncharacterized protein n=1 Tax=Parelaphostrongylus tenuis TaxID=148309 RepID=A0AAD5QQZ9_PARTN|nr:hypothetical protein KIN20_016754 [Parelaphostrongylus tenuis]